MSFDKINDVPHKRSHLCVASHELPRGVNDSSSNVGLPVSLIPWTAKARFRAGWAGLRFFLEYRLGLVVVDDRHRITTLALGRTVAAGGQISAHLRFVCRLCDFGLTR